MLAAGGTAHAQQADDSPAPAGATPAPPDDPVTDGLDVDADEPLSDLPGFEVEWPTDELPPIERLPRENASDPSAPPPPQPIPIEPVPPLITGEAVAPPGQPQPEVVEELAEAEAALDNEEELLTASIGGERVEIDDLIVLNYVGADQFDPERRAAFEDRLRSLSTLRGYEDDEDEIGIRGQIVRRARADRALIERLLRIYGHYDGEVYQSLEREGDADAGEADADGAGVAPPPPPAPAPADAAALPGGEQVARADSTAAVAADAVESPGEAGERRGRRRFDPSAVDVVFDLYVGPLYRYSALDLGGLAGTGADYPSLLDAFAIGVGDPILADDIVEAQGRLAIALGETGYAFAEVGEPSLVIDREAETGVLELPVTPGGKYYFAEVVSQDEAFLSSRHLGRIARFDPGELYQQSRVDDLRRGILATGLVSSLTLTPQPVGTVDGQERVAIVADLTPAPLRTIAGELGYGTGEGVRAEVSWEHRNFFPPEGLVRLRGVLGTQEQLASITYRRNNFRIRDQVLNAQVLIGNIDRPAFEARTVSISANLERQSNLIFQKPWTFSIGAEILATDERDGVEGVATTNRTTYFIGALPGYLGYDATDNLLDPTEGFRLSATVSPEVSFQDGTFFYLRGQVDGSIYQQVTDRVVLAGRARYGGIYGADILQVAPSRRLYAGGGGSVRGYGYQLIGPRDAENDPVGGKSLAEFSLEARVRLAAFGGNFGVVPFIDAGTVTNDDFPDFSELRFGAGLGLRYYSSFGPLRLDIGTPLNPQPEDSPITVYISLGQAF